MIFGKRIILTVGNAEHPMQCVHSDNNELHDALQNDDELSELLERKYNLSMRGLHVEDKSL